MLSYAFQYLKDSSYEDLGKESFDNIYDFFAKSLTIGITQQIKQGLYKEYVSTEDEIATVRGKINIHKSIPLVIQHKQRLNCEFDEFSENNIYNQILKTTGNILLSKVNGKPKEELYATLKYLSTIDEVDVSTIQWNRFRYQRNNQNYEMLINVCHFIIDNYLLSTESKDFKLMNFIDEEHLHKLFEKFVLEYYRAHYPQLKANPSQVQWAVKDDADLQYLPAMITDITLTDKKTNKILIIDTKYYGKTMQSRFDKSSYHNGNMYQILTYVKNKEAKTNCEVAGMLLYAKTEEDITPNQTLTILGNSITVRTLDLNTEFKAISSQLNDIIFNYFEKE